MESGGRDPEQSIRRPIIKNYGCCSAKGGCSCTKKNYWFFKDKGWKAFKQEIDRASGRKPKDKK